LGRYLFLNSLTPEKDFIGFKVSLRYSVMICPTFSLRPREGEGATDYGETIGKVGSKVMSSLPAMGVGLFPPSNRMANLL
jgi:hypothetical protein